MRSESSSNRSATVRIRLIRKIAHHLDGVDVSSHAVGETFELPSAEAGLLVAEGWAIVDPDGAPFAAGVFGGAAAQPGTLPQPDSHDLTLARTLERLRELRAGIEQRRHTTEFEPRRAEDIIREELRDSRAKTIGP